MEPDSHDSEIQFGTAQRETPHSPGDSGFGQQLFGVTDEQTGLDTDPPGELAHDDLAPNVGISFPALSGAQFDVHSTSGTPASIPAGSGLDPVLPHFPSSRTDMQPTVPVHVHEASFARALL